ncbi:DNA helicase [Echinicola pacifica]|uniref:DNA 3'-5' helicase n=1 Tax=Echinicola pacifica TaxID=346377 RepID=A0A918UWW8_9BACT|nr:UvrD-helicase domain-containing protein [Echinicola pacifica]GGZ38865.1 DNA helicase [Echinicola pacifica]
MDHKPFIIYKSSAGSGKTYTLTLEYLKLALAQPRSFKGILAVTFTNKATQEMKDRILSVLERLSEEVRPEEFLDQQLLEHLDCGPELLKQKAAEVLSAILHDYANFSVTTIDSFFQKVVRSFAREIDLQAKFDIALDQQAVLERVIDRVVDLVLEDPFLHQWLVNYALTQIQDGKSWDIRHGIGTLGKELFSENFKRYQQPIREFLSSKENIKMLHEYIIKSKKDMISHAKELGSLANEIAGRFGLGWADFKGGAGGIGRKFKDLGDDKQPFPTLTQIQKENIHLEEVFYTKTSKNKEAIIAAYHAGLSEIIHQLPAAEEQWNTLMIISKNIFAFGVFRNLMEELRNVKDEENILLISDANDFLKEITSENDAPFIYEKVGNQYQHYLIDEFQDTSGFQWDSFKPLLENSLASNRRNLVVGDVKQSIYRWRGGDMKLLLERVETELGEERVESKTLATNYRSLPRIINFNNALFEAFPKLLQELYLQDQELPSPEVLTKAYVDAKQEIPSGKLKQEFAGKVKMEFLENEEVDYSEQVLERLPTMVMELQSKGYQARDIAFLVRKKDHGARIADTLMAYKPLPEESHFCFDVVSNESMFLTKASSVRALVAGMQYLADPTDPVPFETMWFYYASLHGYAINHPLFSKTEKPDWLNQKILEFKDKMLYLGQLPLMELTEELIQVLELMEVGTEKAYIAGFQESVYDYITNNRADLTGFLKWWEDNSLKRSVKIPEGHNAMNILTIHKSKGLQFKVVLMPFLEWKIVDFKSNYIWAPYQDLSNSIDLVLPLSLDKSLGNSLFKPMLEEEVELAYLDTLNMIYVAMTRAEEVLWSVSPLNRLKNGLATKNLEGALYDLVKKGRLNHLDEENTLFDPDSNVFEWGEWPADKPVEEESVAKGMEISYHHRTWSEILEIKKYAADFSPEGLAQRERRSFGLLIHEILEKSVNKEQALEWLRDFYFEGRLDQQELVVVEEQMMILFDQPAFKDWFDGTGKVLSEPGIILPGGIQRRPDKVIIKDKEAIVIDFKTGEEQSRYHRQVKDYMLLVGSLVSRPVRGYLCYLETAKIVEVK